MKTSYKTLLGLNIYRLSSKYIENVRRRNLQRDKFTGLIPEWCVTKDTILLSSYYFQFTSGSEEEWLLFDVEYKHPFIDHEMSAIGEEDFFKEIGLFDFIKNLPSLTENDYKSSIPKPVYIVVKITYTNSYDPRTGEYDCEADYEIVEQLNLNRTIKFKLQ